MQDIAEVHPWLRNKKRRDICLTLMICLVLAGVLAEFVQIDGHQALHGWPSSILPAASIVGDEWLVLKIMRRPKH